MSNHHGLVKAPQAEEEMCSDINETTSDDDLFSSDEEIEMGLEDHGMSGTCDDCVPSISELETEDMFYES